MAEASNRAPERPAATGRPMGVVSATCLVVRKPGLVHKKGVTPSYLVFCPDGPRPGQHHRCELVQIVVGVAIIVFLSSRSPHSILEWAPLLLYSQNSSEG